MSEGALWGLIGVLVTLVVGVPVAVVIGRRFNSGPVLRRAVAFDRLSLLKHQLTGGLKLTFEGRDLDSVSRTYLAVWNDHGGAVKREDVLPADPFRIQVGASDEILQVRMISRSNPLTALRVEEIGGQQRINFSYLDRKDGGVFEVLHTGSTEATIVGTVPGAVLKKPRRAILDVRSAHTRGGGQTLISWLFGGDLRKRRRAFLLVAAILSSVYSAMAAVALGLFFLRRPSVLDPGNYDLTTLDGQNDFASAVTRSGTTDPSMLWAIGIVLVVMGIFAVGTWIAFARTGRGVPRSILMRESQGLDEHAIESIRNLLDAGADLPPHQIAMFEAFVAGVRGSLGRRSFED